MAVPADAFGPYRGTVDLVHDGDIEYVKLDVGFDLMVYTRIRIDGINVPELSTQEGKEARDFAKTLRAPGDAVEVAPRARAERGRVSYSKKER
jgi:endonuclease YncB( thermonuclease family)